MAERKPGLSLYHSAILWTMRLFATCMAIFLLIALVSRFVFGSGFLDRNPGWGEILLLLVMNAFAWSVVAIYPRWARFVDGIVRR